MKALIFSSYTNAYAIYKGAASLDIGATTTNNNPTFPIPSTPGAIKADWLFFTEEASLRRALKGELTGSYLPCQFPLYLLDDKWSLAQWLGSIKGITQGLRQWSLNEIQQVTYPCLLKAKHSWAGEAKLPRGWICHSRPDIEKYLAYLKSREHNLDHFFLQEWLGDSQCRIISVCGFHDSRNSRRNLVALVERIAAHTEGLSCSAAVQTIDDEWQLISRTANILNALDFTGPYEMEYLITNERTLVLELNPRFWMQHAIFLKNGNGLIKRYLEIDTKEDHELHEVKNVVWIDGLHLIASLLRLKTSFLIFSIRKIIESNQQVIIWPNVSTAILVTLRIGFRKLKARLFGTT